ncbi:MAG: hypothetical protein AB7O65_07385, partial [Candidatus Korobacteraceae bacterium]
MSPISRREFVIAGGAFASQIALAEPQAAQQTPARLTVGEVVERIKGQIGVPWNPRGNTVDNILSGNEQTPVRGIATTMFATLDVLQRAAAAGK